MDTKENKPPSKKCISEVGLLQAYSFCTIPLSIYLLWHMPDQRLSAFLVIFILLGFLIVPFALYGVTHLKTSQKTYWLALVACGLSMLSCCNHLGM